MEQKRIFSHVGIAYFLMAILDMGVSFLLSRMISRFAPQLLEYNIVRWILSMLPIYLIAMPVCFWKMKALPRFQLMENRFSVKRLIRFFCICIFIMYAGNIIGNVLSTVIGNVTGWGMEFDLQSLMDGSSPWLILIVAVIIGPILEELFFRKILIDRIIIMGDKTAIVISGLLFGLFHGNTYQFFYAFGLGCMLAYLYIRTGKLRYTAGIHMCVNFMGGFLSVLIMRGIGITELGDRFATDYFATFEFMMNHIGGLAALLAYAVLVIVLFILGLIFFIQTIAKKRYELRSGELAEKGKNMVGYVLRAPGMWLFFIACAGLFYLNMAL